MELYFVRHTTPQIEKGICYGQTDLELAPSFPTEAQKMLEQIPATFDKVYSSPLQRCTQLASKIAPNFETDPRLMELNFGTWEMQNWDDIPKQEIQPWFDDWVNVRANQGESYLELYGRVVEFLEGLPKAGRVAIVTHSGVIRSAYAYLEQVALNRTFDGEFRVGYGGVFVGVL